MDLRHSPARPVNLKNSPALYILPPPDHEVNIRTSSEDYVTLRYLPDCPSTLGRDNILEEALVRSEGSGPIVEAPNRERRHILCGNCKIDILTEPISQIDYNKILRDFLLSNFPGSQERSIKELQSQDNLLVSSIKSL